MNLKRVLWTRTHCRQYNVCNLFSTVILFVSNKCNIKISLVQTSIARKIILKKIQRKLSLLQDFVSQTSRRFHEKNYFRHLLHKMLNMLFGRKSSVIHNGVMWSLFLSFRCFILFQRVIYVLKYSGTCFKVGNICLSVRLYKELALKWCHKILFIRNFIMTRIIWNLIPLMLKMRAYAASSPDKLSFVFLRKSFWLQFLSLFLFVVSLCCWGFGDWYVLVYRFDSNNEEYQNKSRKKVSVKYEMDFSEIWL